jgi:hypothetical protein
MALTDEEVGLAPPRQRTFSDEEVGLAPTAAPATATPGGGSPIEPQFDPAAQPPPTLWGRAKINAGEGFNSTLAGEVVNYNQSGQNAQSAADDLFRAIVEARNAKSPVGLEAYQLTDDERKSRPTSSWASPYAGIPVEHLEGEFNKLSKSAEDKRTAYDAQLAQDKMQADALPPWQNEPGVFNKAVAGLTALGGQVVGGAASPENAIGGFGANVIRRPAESVFSYAARRIAPGAAEGAVGGGLADPVVQSGKIERGEQESYQPEQTATSIAVGAAVGSAFRMSGMLWDAFRASRRKTGQPDAVADTTTPDDVLNQLQADPEFAALARANGVDPFANDPRNQVLQDRLAKRRIEEQFRPEPTTEPPTSADFGTADHPGPAQKEIERRQQERAAVESGELDPAATNVVARQPDQRPIAVDSQGGAFRQDEGATQGRAKSDVMADANVIRLPAPGREHLTDAEIARQRTDAEAKAGSRQQPGEDMVAPEGRAAQTPEQAAQDRQAAEAFTLAERQRERAGDTVRDTQVAGRPQGADQQVIHLDEGHPVEILDRRMVPDSRGNMVEVARVRRYDPRTGKPEPDHVEYDVPVKQLKTGNYAQEPRMAQDFEARAETARINEGRARGQRMDEAQGLPHQTYRTTPPDDNAAGTARASRPEQPPGDHPGQRWSTYEEAMRDFEARQQRGEANPPPGGNTYKDAKSSNQARAKDRDGRFVVDENGHVMSSAEGPIRFADQKQAAKWILNVGQKESPDQIFEIAVHPSGKGFTARERGRSEPPPAGEKPDAASATPPKGEGAPPRPATEPPPAKPDTSPPRQLTGARDEAPRSEPVKQPAPATVQGEPSFSEKMLAERERLWADKDARGYKRSKGRNIEAVSHQARENIMRDEAAPHVEQAKSEYGLSDEDMSDIAAYYRRDEGETPLQALNRAIDQYGDHEERQAILSFDDSDIVNHDWLKPESYHPELEGLYDAIKIINDHYTGGKVDHDAIPFPGDAPKGAARQEDLGRPAAQEGRPGGAEAGREPGGRSEGASQDGPPATKRPNLDAGPDGGKQTVIPGAERITDRELAERRGQQPLRGKNEAPPKGGLFDEDARNQRDMFDQPAKKGGPLTDAERDELALLRAMGADKGNAAKRDAARFEELAAREGNSSRSTLYSNPIFDPQAWKSIGRSLGINGEYFRDLRASYDAMRASWASNSGKKTNGLADVARTIFYSTDGELRAVGQIYKSPTIKKIADMLFAPADMGRGGAVSRTYHEAVEQRTVSNLNKLADILKPFVADSAKLNQIRQLVQNTGSIRRGTPIHDAAMKLRALLDDEFKYLKDAGVDVGKVVDYFPRIVDAERVLRNQADFVEAAVKQYMKDGLAKNRKEADALAQAWLQSIELGHAGAKKDGTDFVMLGGTPNSDFRKERVFGRSIETDKSNPLAKYYIQDPADALTLHFQRTARRAEWSRRFGDDLGEWKKLKQAIVDEGNVAALRQVVDAIGVSTGTQRAYQSDAARTAIGFLRTWGAIKLLPRAAITSLSESAMPAIRSGNLTRVLGDMVRTVHTLAGGMKAERELAADLGLISHAIGDSVLGRRYFALEPGSKVQQDIINRYFRRTGLEQLTNAQRVVAVAAGQTFLRRLAKDVEGDGARKVSSAALLRELGIGDAKGFSTWLKGLNDGMPGLGDIKADAGFSGQYRTALQRFNQQTSLNPNSSTRPKWANHPIGSLAFMLQSYAYAFQKQVLNRAAVGAKEAFVGKGYGLADRATMLAPAMILPALAAIQWGLQAPRDAVFADPSAKEKTPADVFMQVLSRSGLTGVIDPYINMATGVRYGRSAAETLAGPALGSLADLGTDAVKLAVRNSDNTNTAERNFAKAFYDATLLPGISLLASFAPPVIGAGMIQAGSSGAAREGFTSLVAGDKVQRHPGQPTPPRPPKPPKPPRP